MKPPYSLDYIKNHYDPDHDIHLDGPPVTFNEFVLTLYCEWLVSRVENLQEQITGLHEAINKLKSDKIISDLELEQMKRRL